MCIRTFCGAQVTVIPSCTTNVLTIFSNTSFPMRQAQQLVEESVEIRTDPNWRLLAHSAIIITVAIRATSLTDTLLALPHSLLSFSACCIGHPRNRPRGAKSFFWSPHPTFLALTCRYVRPNIADRRAAHDWQDCFPLPH